MSIDSCTFDRHGIRPFTEIGTLAPIRVYFAGSIGYGLSFVW